METMIRATFTRIDDMQKAAEALKRQGVIDLRTDGNTGSTLPDTVEFAAELLEMNTEGDSSSCLALLVSVEKSRFRQAEDTIAACGGTVNIFE